jgi:prepilin-type N-terminal cleavage/methylation domain-containing protein
MRKGGFTLLELLVSLVVIAVIAALAIPAYFGRSEITLENAAVLLAKDLRAAQNRSAYLGEPTRVIFLDGGDGYHVLDALGMPIDNPRNELPFERRYSIDAVFRGVTIAAVELDGETALVFDQHGEPAGHARITLTFDGDERTLLMTPPYGKIEILGSTSGWTDLGY